MDLYLDAVTKLQTHLDRFHGYPKPLLFAVTGVIFAFVGSLIGFRVNPFRVGTVLHVGWWHAVIGLGIGLCITIVQSWHLGRLQVAAIMG